MKTFAGNKTLDQIKAQCKADGLVYDDSRYQAGGDYVLIRDPKCGEDCGYVLYNTVNGNFTGKTPDGVQFDSRTTQHEDQPWFQRLLSFFYREKTAA